MGRHNCRRSRPVTPHPVTMRQQLLYDKNVSHTLKAQSKNKNVGIGRQSHYNQSLKDGWKGRRQFRSFFAFCIHNKQYLVRLMNTDIFFSSNSYISLNLHTYKNGMNVVLCKINSIFNIELNGRKGKKERPEIHRFIMHRNMESSMAQS